MKIKEVYYAFQLDKTRIYEVQIHPCIVYKAPDFSTPMQEGYDFLFSADVFNRPKTDFNRCGQCQDDITKDFPIARDFFNKWDKHHLHKVTDDLYVEFKRDIQNLCETYNYIESEDLITFSELKELSMRKLKTKENV